MTILLGLAIAMMGEEQTFAEVEIKSNVYAYCTATDNHYVLYSDAFLLRNRDLTQISASWKNLLKFAKPRLDNGSDAALPCASVAAPTQYEAANIEATAVSDLQRSSHSVRSFSTGWSF